MAGGGGKMTSNVISTQVDGYLEYKRSLGFKMIGAEKVLHSFARYTIEQDYGGSLTMDIVLEWITSSGKQTDKAKGRKLEVVRPFSKYAAAFDPGAVLITGKVFRNSHARPEPYIYSKSEVILLMQKCDNLYSPDGIRARTVKTIIGLLWATGMRPAEPEKLRVRDVDLEKNTLFIRKTKFSRDRIIPVSASTAGELSAYKRWVGDLFGRRAPEDPFFYTTFGKPMTERKLYYAFSLIRGSIGAAPKGYREIRLYDFRHTLACNTILRWLKEGIDINSRLHTLSVYLGHTHPEDTYWYLSATPELLRAACCKYEEQFGGDDDE